MTTMECPVCEKVLKNQHHAKKYCSKKCRQKHANKLLKERHPNYHRDYQRTYKEKFSQKIREEARFRYHHLKDIKKTICCVCGSVEKLELHHEEYSEIFIGSVLCSSCHLKRHKKLRDEEYREKLIGLLKQHYLENPDKLGL